VVTLLIDGVTKMSPAEWAWAAGYFDGDGCIWVQRCHSLYAAISTNCRAAIQKFCDEWVGNMSFRMEDRLRRPQYGWRIGGERVKIFGRAVLPFLVEKEEQVRLSWEFPIGIWGGGYRPLTSEQHEKRKFISSRLRELKRAW